MNENEYKEHIKKEYERLFSDEPVDVDKKPFYHFIMYSNEGVEMYRIVRSQDEIDDGWLKNMQLRCRFNAHRDLNIYAFRSPHQIDEKAINKKFLNRQSVVKISF